MPLVIENAPAIQLVFPQWEIVRHLARVPWPYPEDGALAYVRDVAVSAMSRGEAWHWSIRRREEPEELIGLIGLTLGEEDNRGFWIAPEWQGQGLMTEAVIAVTRFWFDDLGQAVLRVPKAVANLASRRISEKQGMRVVWTGERDYLGGRGATELWEITAEEWRVQEASTLSSAAAAASEPAFGAVWNNADDSDYDKV